MSERPWMPLYVGDYLADTAHLRTEEHGAYLLLLMHYWRTKSLPNDDAKLARIARLTPAEWRRARPVIEPFFYDGWKHKRVEFELAEAARISQAGRAGGLASAKKRRAKSNRNFNDRSTTVQRLANDQPTIWQAPQSQSHSEPKGSGEPPSDPKADLFRRGREVFGKTGGGLTAKLLRQLGNEDDPKVIAKARARVEEASAKAAPAEWIGRVLAGKAKATTPDGQPYPEGII